MLGGSNVGHPAEVSQLDPPRLHLRDQAHPDAHIQGKSISQPRMWKKTLRLHPAFWHPDLMIFIAIFLIVVFLYQYLIFDIGVYPNSLNLVPGPGL